jgi:DNA-binding response OmpR family regulator
MMTILVVDDDQSLATALSRHLRCAGFRVLTAYSAEAAAELAVRERPDLILLDIDMPHYTGLELHQCLKCSTRAGNIPVLFLSGNDGITHRTAALEQGAIGLIAKPCEPVRLIQIVNDALGCAAASSTSHVRQLPLATSA